MNRRGFFTKVDTNILVGGINVMDFLPNFMTIEEEQKAKVSRYRYDGRFFSRIELVKKNLSKKMFSVCIKILDNLNRRVLNNRIGGVYSHNIIHNQGLRLLEFLKRLSNKTNGMVDRKLFVKVIVSTLEWLEEECKKETGIDIFENADIKMRNANIGQSVYFAGIPVPEYNIPI